MNGCSLLYIPVRFGSCLAFFYGKISAVYCKSACLGTHVKGVNPSRQGRHVLCVLDCPKLVLQFISARRQWGVSGLESDFAPREDRHRSRSLVGDVAGGGGSPAAPPSLAAFTLMLCRCRVTIPEGGTPDPLTYVPGCVEPPQHTPKGAVVARCVGTDPSGLVESCSATDAWSSVLPGLIPTPGSTRTSQTPRVHLCASPELGFQLCRVLSSLLACVLP